MDCWAGNARVGIVCMAALADGTSWDGVELEGRWAWWMEEGMVVLRAGVWS